MVSIRNFYMMYIQVSRKMNPGLFLIAVAVVKIALQRHGYNVFGFTDPFLALEHFKINHSTYSLVLSDLRMPSL
jgi:hypothetical protein